MTDSAPVTPWCDASLPAVTRTRRPGYPLSPPGPHLQGMAKSKGLSVTSAPGTASQA